jgi:integrase
MAPSGSIPAEKMKMRCPHRVPLAPRAMAILRELHAITGRGKFVFPSVRSRERCMSENTVCDEAGCRRRVVARSFPRLGQRAATKTSRK